jgi:hypothetical protein
MANLARGALSFIAGIAYTQVIDTHFVRLGAADGTTASVSAKAIKALLGGRARDVSTAKDTFSISAETVHATVNTIAWVRLTPVRSTPFTLLTTGPATVIRATLTVLAYLAFATLDTITEIDAPGRCAGLSFASTPLLLAPWDTGTVGAEHVFLIALALTIRVTCVQAGAAIARQTIATGFALIEAAIAVIINPIAGFLRDSATATTEVSHSLIDMTIAIIILEVTDFSRRRLCCDASSRTTYALPSTDRTASSKTRCAFARDNDRTPVRVHVDEPITVVIATIANLWITIWRAKDSITGITLAVTVSVCLLWIRDLWAIVTEIANPITIVIGLGRIRNRRAVVIFEADLVGVFIGAR